MFIYICVCVLSISYWEVLWVILIHHSLCYFIYKYLCSDYVTHRTPQKTACRGDLRLCSLCDNSDGFWSSTFENSPLRTLVSSLTLNVTLPSLFFGSQPTLTWSFWYEIGQPEGLKQTAPRAISWANGLTSPWRKKLYTVTKLANLKWILFFYWYFPSSKIELSKFF